jgi:hypothetical protein
MSIPEARLSNRFNEIEIEAGCDEDDFGKLLELVSREKP